jgi:hypothetical protein
MTPSRAERLAFDRGFAVTRVSVNSQIKLSKIVIIAADAVLAEQVCARFRTPRTYVVAIEAPKERLVEYAVYKNDCIGVGNAVEAVEPDCVLFLGCSDAAFRAIRAHFDESRRTIAGDINLKFGYGFTDNLDILREHMFLG